MSIVVDQLIARILAFAPDASGYWVAFSGGLDSHVLLHALAQAREGLPAPLRAVHVNHNLQSDAPAWAEHCREVCAALGLECDVLRVQADARPGESPEAAARAARYRALTKTVMAGGVLLTAHHQDDQAETLLLQLLRGAGPKGLAAMPACTRMNGVLLLRPLLEVPRRALHAYALHHNLGWVDDPSNACADYDRNFLRHEILPRVRRRWPTAGDTLARAARHQAEAARLLAQLAEADWQQTLPSTTGGARSDPTLAVSALLRLDAPRRANLLRYWLQSQGATMPSTAVLAQIDRAVLGAAADAQPLVRWGKLRLRRYRDRLYLDDVPEEGDPSRCLDWRPSVPLGLPGGTLYAERVTGAGVALHHAADPLQVRFRRGGESLRPAGRREHHTLKHLFQAAGVPPWERARVPLIYRADDLLAVAGYWVNDEFRARPDEPGMCFTWSRSIVPPGSIW